MTREPQQKQRLFCVPWNLQLIHALEALAYVQTGWSRTDLLSLGVQLNIDAESIRIP